MEVVASPTSHPVARLEDLATRQAAGDQAIRWEVGDDFATILGDDHLFLDPGGAGSVISAAPRFKREHHSFAKRLVLVTVALRKDRPLPKGKAHPIALLQKQRPRLVTTHNISQH